MSDREEAMWDGTCSNCKVQYQSRKNLSKANHHLLKENTRLLREIQTLKRDRSFSVNKIEELLIENDELQEELKDHRATNKGKVIARLKQEINDLMGNRS